MRATARQAAAQQHRSAGQSRPPNASRRRYQTITAQAEGLLGFLRWGSSGGSSAGRAAAARQQLLQELRSGRPDKQRIGECCDELMAAEVAFNESQLGGGPFHVVFTRGPLLWALWTSQAQQGSRLTRASDNQAWQDFEPASKALTNFGQLLGNQVCVTASGSYAAADERQRCPKLVRATVRGGALSAWGVELPLPIRGEGLVEVAYLDPELRIFRATNGSISLQVRQDRLPKLLGWQAQDWLA